MNTLILGSDGMVGRALSKIIPNAVKSTHETADVTQYDAMFKLFSAERPDMVYMAAALTNVDACEDIRTNKINIAGALLVARLCEMFGAKFVYFSSGYVFNGKSKHPYSEHEETSPVQQYGIQKETVENSLLMDANAPEYVIIRTIGVFGEAPRNKNYVKQIASTVKIGDVVHAPADQYMNPILASDLAEISVALATKRHGIFHVAGDTCMSKFEYAKHVADYFGKAYLVEGISSGDLAQKALRPRMACLDCSTLAHITGMSAPSFQKGLERYLTTQYGP